MYQVTVEEAAARLPELIHEAGAGEEVILMQDNHAVAKLTALPSSRPRARRGSGKGLVLPISDDFDSTPEGFEEYTS